MRLKGSDRKCCFRNVHAAKIAAIFELKGSAVLVTYVSYGIPVILSTIPTKKYYNSYMYMNTMGRVLNFSQGLSNVSNVFDQNINLGYDLVFVLQTNPMCTVCHDNKL